VTEPVFVVIFGIILLDETITFLKMIGMLTILSGALITLFSKALKRRLTFKRKSVRDHSTVRTVNTSQ
jgi:drug/metabolite transporter (DMT)-like permease